MTQPRPSPGLSLPQDLSLKDDGLPMAMLPPHGQSLSRNKTNMRKSRTRKDRH